LSAWSFLPLQPEFWSAIAGAIVGAITGGIIAYVMQVKALREGRAVRAEDQKLNRQAQGRALLLKMGRIISNYHSIREHFDGHYNRAHETGFVGEPWEFILPTANAPDPVYLSMDELGMLLSLKNNEVFNSLVGLDAIHNGLIDVLKLFNAERRALTERLPQTAIAEQGIGEQGNMLSGFSPREVIAGLRPRMIEVNMLAEQLRVGAKNGFTEATTVTAALVQLLKQKLGLSYNVSILDSASR